MSGEAMIKALILFVAAVLVIRFLARIAFDIGGVDDDHH
jgi:hypothetical protein